MSWYLSAICRIKWLNANFSCGEVDNVVDVVSSTRDAVVVVVMTSDVVTTSPVDDADGLLDLSDASVFLGIFAVSVVVGFSWTLPAPSWVSFEPERK